MMFRRVGEQDIRRIDAALQALASDCDEQSAPLPDPAFIWWKAQLLRRRDAEQEALAPINVGDRVHFAVAVIVALASRDALDSV